MNNSLLLDEALMQGLGFLPLTTHNQITIQQWLDNMKQQCEQSVVVNTYQRCGWRNKMKEMDLHFFHRVVLCLHDFSRVQRA